MRHLLPIVEQMDRASGELAVDHPINNRLALILIDNAVELLLHRECTDLLQEDTLKSNLKKMELALRRAPNAQELFPDGAAVDYATLTRKQRTLAGGDSMPGKVKVLVDLGKLTCPEGQFIKAVHGYRNQLYHVGLRYDDIIRALAGRYFLLCSNLLVRLRPKGITYSSRDTYTEVAERYLPIRDGMVFLEDVDFEELSRKLRCALPDAIPDLPEILAKFAIESIDEIEKGFNFLIQDNPINLGSKELLKVVQWRTDLEKKLEKNEISGLWADPSYREEVDEVATNLRSDWRQRYFSLPTARWRDRANAIGAESCSYTAMHSYQQLRNDMAYLEEAIQSAAEELDRWIQTQIDIARGK